MEDNLSEEEKRRKELEDLYTNDNEYDDPIEGDPTHFSINPDIGENVKGIWAFLKSTVSFKEGADVDGTIKNIREGINFAGPNVWVLMCSIIVASVGLNTNSVAVIIGAMLISPLMGPIRGMGLGAGTNDIRLIIDSLKNFGVAVGISLLTAYLYFLVTPLTEVTPELIGRTGPNLMDVFIAFFGGLAGIIAASRGDNSTVIPGVAIATALMPPLCTAGYGLANGNWPFFFGSAYLFLLNTLFICLSTIIVVRYLKFPLRHFINPKVEKKVKILSYILIFLIIVPAGFLFYGKIQETVFIQNSRNFAKEIIDEERDLRLTENFIYNGNDSKVELLLANKVVGASTIERWRNKMAEHNLDPKYLSIVQGTDYESSLAELRNEVLNNGNADNGKGYDLIQSKENELKRIEDELSKAQRELMIKNERVLDVNSIVKNISLNYPTIGSVEVYSGISADKTEIIDSVFAIAVHYKDSLPYHIQVETNERLKKQLQIQLEGQKMDKNCRIKVYTY